MHSRNGVIPCYYFRARRVEVVADCGFAAIPVSAIVAAVKTVHQTRLRLVAATLAVFAGGLKYSAIGSSDLFPSLNKRAQNHVNAGAEMTRIQRLAKFYKSDLQAFPPGNSTCG